MVLALGSHSHLLPRTHPDVAEAKRRPFSKKKKHEYQTSAYLVSTADHEMWHSFSSHLTDQGGEVEFYVTGNMIWMSDEN